MRQAQLSRRGGSARSSGFKIGSGKIFRIFALDGFLRCRDVAETGWATKARHRPLCSQSTVGNVYQNNAIQTSR